MKKLFILLMLMAAVSIASAQVAGYTFSQSTSTYTEITGGTVLGDTTIDEQRFVDPAVPLGGTTLTGPGLPIGFNFIYNGNTFDVFAVNTNGWISFGQSTLTPNPVDMTSTSYILPISTASTAAAVLQNRLSLFGRNIAGQFGSDLEYLTSGTAPNRILTIQWKHFRRNTQIGEDFNFQIKLYETTNEIEFVYGAVTVNASNATAPQVGLRGAANTDFNNRTTTADWSATTAGTVNTASMTISLTVFPTSGLTYTWTPPVVYQYDAGITAINSPAGAISLGSNNVNVTVKNFGTSTLTAATIGWKVDGTSQTDFAYTNPGLVQNATDGPILIGTYNFTTTGSHIIKVWTSNPNGNTDQNTVNDTVTQNVYVQNYGPIPYLQNFDNTWMNKLATDDAPDQYWLNTPSTGSNSWRRDDDGASAAWTGTGGAYTPAGANSTVHSARFHTNGTVSGTTGTLDLYLDFSPVGTKLLKFWNINTGGTDSLTVSMSTDGGATFSVLQKYNIVAAWTQQVITLGTSVSPTVVLRFVGKSNAGQSDIGLDEVIVTIPSPNDAGVVSIDSPGLTVLGNASVAISVKDFGTDSLKTAYINWSVNGTNQSAFAYTNTPGLAPDSTDGPVAIGTYNFNTSGYYTIKAWTTLPNGNSDGDNTNDTTIKTVYVQGYAPIPFTEDFDNAWINKFNTRDVPSLYWTNTPISGNDSWRRDDDGASGTWTQPTGGAYTPGGANNTANSARFHTYYAPAADTGTIDAFLNFSTAGTKMLKFWYINPSGTDAVSVLLSLDSGATFNLLQSFDTSSVWTEKIISLGTYTNPGVVLRFKAVSDYGNDDLGIDRVMVYFPGANDVGVTQIISPVSGSCGNIADPVKVIVTNFGTAAQSNIPVVAHILTPGSPVTLNATLAGPLASATSDTLLVGTVNTVTPGNYTYTVYTNMGTDADNSNDTDKVILTVVPITQPNLGGNDSLCGNQSITLDAGSGFDTYLWSTGAVMQTLYVDTTGIGLGTYNYWVEVTLGGCSGSDTVSVIFSACSGIVEYGSQASVTIYPNPTNGMTNIVVEGLNTAADLGIFNVQGQQVYTNRINGNSTSHIDLGYLPKGVYIVRLFNEKNSIVRKLIIQ